MFNIIKPAALACAVLPLGLFMSGCALFTGDGIGMAGVHHVEAGNWQAARVDFAKDYSEHPEHPIAVFNAGDSYHHDGDIVQADAKFSDAAAIGKAYHPDVFLEPDANGATIAMMACRHLHEDHRLDSNCGDQIAIEAPPAAPRFVAESGPTPQPAAQATEISPRPPKQDRN
jgi:hypothetical protein